MKIIRHQVKEVQWKVSINEMDLKFCLWNDVRWIRDKRWWSNYRRQETQIMEMLHSLVITKRFSLRWRQEFGEMKFKEQKCQGRMYHQRMKARVILESVLNLELWGEIREINQDVEDVSNSGGECVTESDNTCENQNQKSLKGKREIRVWSLEKILKKIFRLTHEDCRSKNK